MLICFMCDLHLSYNKRTVQYDALDWACSDLKNKRADAVVFAGDFTADGNIFAAKRFVRKIQSLTVPCIVIPGNSDCRTPKNISYMQSLCSPCENILSEKIKIFAVNDSEKFIDQAMFETLEKADESSIVVMHHPSGSLEESSKNALRTGGNAMKRPCLYTGIFTRAALQGILYHFPHLILTSP